METFSKEWFELSDLRKRRFEKFAWIPVFGSKNSSISGTNPNIGHAEELFVFSSAAIYSGKVKEVEDLDWNSWSGHGNRPFFGRDGKYFRSADYILNDVDVIGFHLVLSQSTSSPSGTIVQLNQDFVFAYGLIYEEGKWLRPSEGYEEVARAEFDDAGQIKLVEIRAEYLRDYLAATGTELRLYYFMQRDGTFRSDPNFGWPEDFVLVDEPHNICEVRCWPVGQDGDLVGASWAIFRSWRTDVDTGEDIPDFPDEDDTNTGFETKTGTTSPEIAGYRTMGELWRGEWIRPTKAADRIGDLEPKEDFYVWVDASGAKTSLASLNSEEVGKYLWFAPELANALTVYRGSKLIWYTGQTGGITAGGWTPIHFGVNSIGLINAYAYDIAKLPHWERRVWASHNVRADGGVSEELLAAQMETKPARTAAAEKLISFHVDYFEQRFAEKFGQSPYSAHEEIPKIGSEIHRFKGLSEESLRRLAKDLFRFSLERLNKKALLAATKNANKDLNSLKLLQAIVEDMTNKDIAYRAMSPLFGLYDLRNSDAHLGSSDLDSCYERLRIDRAQPFVLQAERMIGVVAITIGSIGRETVEPGFLK